MAFSYSPFGRWLAWYRFRQWDGRGRAVKPRSGFTPRLTRLEDRTVPSAFTVLNLNDGGAGSLRAALAAADAHTGADTVVFAPGLRGTVTLTGGELSIADSVTVNGP